MTRGMTFLLLFLALPACAPDPLRDAARPNDDPVRYLPLEHLATLGVHAERIDGAHVLLYGGAADDWQHAVCATALDCSAAKCPRYEEAALPAPKPCPAADDSFERGVCGPFRWVATRDVVRWFDRSGALTTTLTSDPSPAFCSGRAGSELAGPIPECHHAEVARHVCGAASSGSMEMVGELLDRMRLPAGN